MPEKFGYIFSRIKTFLDPKSGDNFQSQRALEAIKEGGLTGQGMGEGILKDKVPEAHTDYIIAVISEEFGVIFVLFIVIIFLFIGYKVLNKVISGNDEFLKLSLVGLVSLLIIQMFIHVGVNSRLFPTTGMTLPFLSYGGSSLLGSSIAAGIILNFTRKILQDILKMNKKIIFSSGGTGGHILPAIHLMNHFSEKGYEVLLVTDYRGKKFINDISKFRSYEITTDTPTNKNSNLRIFFIFFNFLFNI